MSKGDKNVSDTYLPNGFFATFLLPHFDIICDLLPNRSIAILWTEAHQDSFENFFRRKIVSQHDHDSHRINFLRRLNINCPRWWCRLYLERGFTNPSLIVQSQGVGGGRGTLVEFDGLICAAKGLTLTVYKFNDEAKENWYPTCIFKAHTQKMTPYSREKQDLRIVWIVQLYFVSVV